MGRSRRAATLVAALGLALTGVVALAPAPAGAAGPPPPTPTPARVGPPTSMAALGDSITQATGTGQLAEENPKNSWSTGWEVSSVRARLGIPTGSAQNLSANGARMGDADAQVLTGRDGQALRPGTQYVTIEMGGNDLCRDSVAEMTSTATYRTQLEQALAAIRSRAPEALVHVMSVPDIYNLWYIRGAPQNGTYHPEPESDQAGGLNGARFYWGQSFFPCRSLLAEPDSYSQADRARRAAVRQRTMDYNAALRAECAEWLRCRYDDDRLFDLTSNRASPPNGPLLPRAQWTFDDLDISRNEGVGRYLCPVQGVIAGGCGDHFHPSLRGQGKLADSATASSYQWSDATAPSVGLTPSPAPRPDGTFRGPVTVTFSGADASGLRGQEVRVHRPDGTVTPWSPSPGGVHPPITVSGLGTTHVEARSLDQNGNLSASKVLTLALTATAPGATGTPTLAAAPGTLAVTWPAVADDGGSPVTGHEVEVTSAGATSVTPVGPAAAVDLPVRDGRSFRVRVRAVNAQGPGPWSAPSAVALPPLASPATFVEGLYADLALRPPTAEEVDAGLAALDPSSGRPADLARALLGGAAWEGTLAPVVRLYRASFLRVPDADGLAYWEGRARSGTSVRSMADFFTRSREFVARYGSLGDREFVRRVYLNVLDREPDATGWDFWTAELQSGRWSRGRMMTYYAESAEHRIKSASLVTPVVVWWGLLQRVPTPAEVSTAATSLATDPTGVTLVDDVLASPEWVAATT
ncbi:DUF4214 domain-containing protein [Iamia majanohamensis]|uniref:DUF4214 domain-containing protein n=1 Tax=Iamia majanohamensis TaxID=467976 RepID=A0AAE9Y654_9ACTN|nr:DUF4214 domain-containing protein [Iamia majanohamensis]WCO65028.1 DUF4214 domain-containing protein [Iamia majanohamensis]